MKIITGLARGRVLYWPEGEKTRPTAAQVKEALFSVIQFDIEGRTVLDLFAGSGQLGLEALSRGAAFAHFVDFDKDAINIIEKNIKICGFENFSKVYKTSYDAFLKLTDLKFDIVFLDPPYAFGGAARADTRSAPTGVGCINHVFELLKNKINFGGKIVYEHDFDNKPPENIDFLTLHKTYKYGKKAISIFVNK